MSDRMVPIPFGEMMNWILKEKNVRGSIFGVRSPYFHKGGKLSFLSEKIETPFGPAAGPHTQLAQNIIAAYAGGARFFELKTVQTIDGKDLPVSKPCIDARDECYNVEWSTELTVPQALDEYIKAWFALKLISVEFDLGAMDGFVFNMSVGYDLEGIISAKIDFFIEGLKDASNTKIWTECKEWAKSNIDLFKQFDSKYIETISPVICRSITLSTLHGCPPQEIERIAGYLIEKKHLDTFIKCNPTLLGYDFARNTMDKLGFSYILFDDHHFKTDLQYCDAVPMIKRLMAISEREGRTFGVKLTNTLPVDNSMNLLAGDEMYMSGRALFPLTAEAARRLSDDFSGKLRISWSGGADYTNISKLYRAGIWPITLATTLLKPGGYQRLKQIAEKLADRGYKEFRGVDVEKAEKIAVEALSDKYYEKESNPLKQYKTDRAVPLLDCFIAPCSEGCPIGQNIPEYLALAREGRYEEALLVILDKNPLPFITGTICNHICMTRCTRNFYDKSVQIRSIKLEAAEKGIDGLLPKLSAPAVKTEAKVAIIGGGPAGLASAFFLGRNGIKATVFESSDKLGGVVRRIIPEFRVSSKAVDCDVRIVKSMGADFVLNSHQTSVKELREKGYKYIIFANGAWKHGHLNLQKGTGVDVFDFLSDFKTREDMLSLGENVAVIGGGNTAMDAARAAKRISGVKNVCIVYRRTSILMPADREELQLAVNDGVEFMELLAPIAHENGILRCARVILGESDESGRKSPIITDETMEIPADTVIVAVGESIDKEIVALNGIGVTDKGKVITDLERLETKLKGVYVAGDARRGPSSVVEAIADARRIVSAITENEGLQVKTDFVEKKTDFCGAIDKKGIISFPSDRKSEADRCLECSTVCENCVDVCPNRANISVTLPESLMTQIIHVDTMCNECGNCTAFCPWNSSPFKDKFTYFASSADFYDSKNSGFMLLKNSLFKIRLEGEVFTSDVYNADEKLPRELASLIVAAVDQIPILRR